MNLYTALTLRYLKENKKRTIVTIIGIILSTALICGIGNIYNSFMDYQVRETVQRNGDFHATFYDVQNKDIGKITKSAGISKYGYSDNLGFGRYNDEKFLLQIKSYDKESFDGYQISLKEGKLPTNNKEIVVSEDSNLLKEKKIGDIITISVGKRVTKDGDTLTGSWMDEDEKLIDTHKEEYKIVGIISKPGFEDGRQITTAISYLDINKMGSKDDVNVSITANNPKEIYNIAGVIAKNLGLKVEGIENGESDSSYYNNENGTYYENLQFNEHLLRLQSASAYDNINGGIDKIIILVTSLVIICTIATVYNAFSISISERKRQFGILNSIGATKSQTTKLVLMEAFLVSIIGIPLGLLAGTVAIDIVFKIIGSLYGSSLIGELGLRVVYSPAVIILSAIIVIITILISAILPARQASKISPLESIKNSSNLKIGKVKDSKIVRALFKAEGVLAYKNLRRNKKKFRITLFSLIISVVIFISFSGFMTLFINANKVQFGEVNYDLRLSSSTAMDDKPLEELKNIPGINRVAEINDYSMGVYLPENKINENNEDLINDTAYFSKEKIDNKTVYDILNCLIKLPGDFEINKINLKEGSFEKKEAIKENGVIFVRKSYYEEPGKKYEFELTNYKVGDTVKAYISDYDGEKEIRKEIDLKIMAITDDISTGNSGYNYMGLDFITYDEVGKKFGLEANANEVYISTNGDENIRNTVKDIANQYAYNVSDIMENVKSMQDTLMVMQIFVYGFVTVISLVSITNIVNTISTNINLRKRELAIIKSIGVTPGGFNKMIYLESLLYGALALIYGIPLGIGLVALMNVILGDVIQMGLVLPWSAIAISAIGIFVITFISAYIPMKKINKENIIENIRQESI
ncbi:MULTISPECIES: ABC transporter permease [Terrisporobacter]|uniref:ABC transporter permease n=1 Tax=Terrisporobacter TaxID=1505652 RepID=UPI00265A299E|nr:MULTISPECIES: ABC transporter permease [Terrisporobacter]MCC3668231.1 ABC transporter permease [Terrisporobacter mayombei]MDU6982878.1 FtsX-like permease family protein [Terrisporobacter othiniensis]